MKTSMKKDYMSAYRNKIREKAKDALGGKCVICGSIDCLEFDHIHPYEKIDTIANMIANGSSMLDKELKKCQLLCKKCHVLKTKKDGSLKGAGKNQVRGEKHPRAKLKEEDVQYIKILFKENVNVSKIAKDYNVSVGTIKSIKNGYSWKHIQ
jgi:5-methylcytosine-specific restriction endonuclease McrA